MKKMISVFLRGIPIGISLTLPGVSGGTIALVLGIYDRLIQAIRKLKLNFLVPIGLGAVLGIWIGSGFITYLLDSYHNPTIALLLGLVLFSTKVTLKEARYITVKGLVAVAVSFIIAVVLWNFSIEEVMSGTVSNIQLFFAGFISSVAMILPGISGATLLIMLGLYGGVLEAVTELNFLVLLFYGLGAVFGLFAFSWILSFLLSNHRTITMMTLTGLILGSARAVIPSSFGIVELISFFIGAGIILLLSNEKVKEYIRKLTN